MRDRLKNVLGNKKDRIISLYVYGSYLEEREPNDIDLFVIIENGFSKKMGVIKECKKVTDLKGYPIDWNIKTEDEFRSRVHVNRPVTYFIGIKKRSKLLFGEHKIKEVKESEIKSSMIIRRAYEIAQRARHCYVNSENVNFWRTKLRKRALSLVSELLFLEGEVALNYSEALNAYISHEPVNRDHLKVLRKDDVTLERLWVSLERILNTR
jgi:predicted nucleotidyltransferase